MNWQENIIETTILRSATEENFRILVQQQGKRELNLLFLSCRTQAVERAAQALPETSDTPK